jgi:nucleolar protein 4
MPSARAGGGQSVAGSADDAATDARTLFVRNVGYDVDAAQLEEVFADVGPVRQSFLVTDKGGGRKPGGGQQQRRHKGIAFVQFAIPEDAERALEQLDGRALAGRRLKVRGCV